MPAEMCMVMRVARGNPFSPEQPGTLRPPKTGGTMEEQVENSASPIAGHMGSNLARRFAADDYNGLSVLVLNCTDVLSPAGSEGTTFTRITGSQEPTRWRGDGSSRCPLARNRRRASAARVAAARG